MTKTQKTWRNERQEMRRLNHLLAEVGRKHEEELKLKLAKIRRHD